MMPTAEPPRVLVMTVAVELLPDDDPMMVGTGIATAAKEAVGDRQGVASMRGLTHAPIEDVLDDLAEGTRLFDLSAPPTL